MSGEGYPTQPMLVKDASGNMQVSHAWQRFLQSQWRKLGQATDNAPVTSANIYGILASLNMNPNGVLNSTNYCTVDSVDNGTSATIRCYGSGGVGTTWTRQVGSTTFGPYPALSQAGAAYTTDYYVMFNPSTPAFVITTNFADILPDGYFWCGKTKTIDPGGGGGTTGGGGGTGGSGGVCFTGNTTVETDKGPKQFYELPTYPVLITTHGPRTAKLVISPYDGWVHRFHGDQWATPSHPFKRGDSWQSAESLFPERKLFSGHVYNAHILDPDEDTHNYKLACGEIVHNLSMI